MPSTSNAPSDRRIFLSYASVDRDRALAVADALESAGIPVWIDRRGIPGGSVWIEEIARAVRECPILLVLCSEASVVSRNVRQELQLAWDQNKPILPLLLEPVEFPDGVAYVLHGRQWIDLSGREPTEWVPEVARAISGKRGSTNRRGLVHETPIVAAAPPTLRQSNSLHAPKTRLIGRERELAAVVHAIVDEGARLVTLTGPGGTGKTRVAIEVASQLGNYFSNRVYQIDLASVRNPETVLSMIAQAVRVKDLGGQPIRETLRVWFADQPALLILDNFEQLLDSAPLLADLLADSPTMQMLVTSRALLRLSMEQEIQVPPLAGSESVSLFVDRASASQAGFMLNEENTGAVVEICRRLDGLPLAIELAASRVKLLSPQALLARLERRLPLLTGGARDLPARQQTLSNTIAWSYDLLTPSERSLLRQLSVFVGGWTLQAAEYVCAFPEDVSSDLLDALSSLVDKSLVLQTRGSDGESRFGMLETIREFALDRLMESGAEQAVRLLHATWCLSVADKNPEVRFVVRRRKEWLQQLGPEIGNLRAALVWLTESDQAELNLRLATEMSRYWWFAGPIGEARVWLDQALAKAIDAPPEYRVLALSRRAFLASAQGDAPRLKELATEGLSLTRTIGDRRNEVIFLNLLGILSEMQRESALAETYHSSALALARDLRRDELIGMALTGSGLCAWKQGKYPESIAFTTAALPLFEVSGDTYYVAITHYYLGQAIRDGGDAARAVVHIRESVAIFSEWGRNHLLGLALVDLASLIAEFGDAGRASRLLGAAERFREAIGLPISSFDETHYVQAVATARDRLGSGKFEEQFRAGRDMPWEQAIEEALMQTDSSVNQAPL